MDPDSSPTFDSLVIGPANRLASAAARRAAESPGTTYNPLFLYSEPGLGKSHILSAIVHHARASHTALPLLSQSSEEYLEELDEAIEDGTQDELRARYLGLELLLLDDVQAIAGHLEGQQTLLRLIDELSGKGAQIVLASDKPPAEIEGLDGRLIRRFSDGLIVDLGVPDYEMRIEILTRWGEASGVSFRSGVLEALARGRFKDVPNLQAAFDQVVSVQRVENRMISPEDLTELFANETWLPRARRTKAEKPSEKPSKAPKKTQPPAAKPIEWRAALQAVIDSARIDSIAATPLVRLLEEPQSPIGWRTTLREFAEGANRVREIRKALKALGDPWPETSAGLLTDTEHLEEAENLLALARERMRPFPPLPGGEGILGLAGRFPVLVLKAAEQLIREVSTIYKPLYIHSPDQARRDELLFAAGRSFSVVWPTGVVAHVSVPEFAQELVQALTNGVAGAWRERWWSVDLLLLHGIERLPDTGRAQDEFFHLLQALGSRGARIILSSDRAPGEVMGIPERLALKLEEGFVVDLGTGLSEADAFRPGRKGRGARESLPSEGEADETGVGREGDAEVSVGATSGPFELDPERVVWNWPTIEARIVDLEGVPVSGGRNGD